MKYFLIFLLMAGITLKGQAQSGLTPEILFQGSEFRMEYPEGIASMQNGQFYTRLVEGDSGEQHLISYRYNNGSVADTLMKPSDFYWKGNMIAAADYLLNESETRVLITANTEQIFRHSSASDYFIFTFSDRSLKPVSESGKQQEAAFSPDGNKVAFVRNNNLFFTDLASGMEIQVTSDGKKNHIINGICDWVYEEEFSFTKAFAWSADSRKLAFYRFDESLVKEYTIQYFRDVYPENYTYKYPKVGERNSEVAILIYHIGSGKMVKADTGPEADQYLPRMKWANENELCISRMNRLQNKIELLLVNAENGTSRVLFTEENSRYIDIHNDLTFLKSQPAFLWSSEKSGFRHLYLYDMNGKLLNNITAGNYDVTQFYGLDEKTKTVYYQSAEPSPLERHVYRCRLDGSGKIQLTESAGWNEAEFNNDFSFFLQTWSNANTPFIFSIHSSNGKPVRVLETNEALQAKRKQYNFQDVEFYQFAISSGEKLNGFMLKPQNFDASKKYPVFMTLYGGPGSQEVVNQYGASSNWHQYLLQQGYIVACVDNRGTGGRGEEFKKCTYLRLGEWEVQDQIEAAKHLGSLPYVDASRIGIFGWSYGGYMSTFCLAQGNSVFKAAIAVAPVTDWRFYDTIYTERFMRTEKENKEGYDRTAPLNFADKIRGNYLLVHGLADDNVHYQNAAELMKKLYASNVKFDQFTFPDKNHGIYGGNTRYYLFSQILDWIEENL